MFHGRFLEGQEYDESRYAKILVEHAKGIYNETIPTASDFINDLPDLS